MIRRMLVIAAALAVATPAWARQTAQRDPDDPAKSQVQTFEMALKAAVESGARSFAQRAAEMVPVMLQAGDAPIVDGVAFRGEGRTNYVFHVQVPNIWPVIQVMSLMPRQRQGPSTPVSGGNDPRSSADIVVSDPLGSSVNASNRADLEREYAMNVRSALVDSVLDNALVLPLAAGDMVFIFASGSDAPVANSLYRTTLRKLVLPVSGSDLLEFRQGKLTRDEVKRRIRVSSF